MGLLSQMIRSSSVRVAMLSQRGDNFNVLADTAWTYFAASTDLDAVMED